MWAHDHCTLECDRRPCHLGHCDRFWIEQEHPDYVRVNGNVLTLLEKNRHDLASGTFVPRDLFVALGYVPESNA